VCRVGARREVAGGGATVKGVQQNARSPRAEYHRRGSQESREKGKRTHTGTERRNTGPALVEKIAEGRKVGGATRAVSLGGGGQVQGHGLGDTGGGVVEAGGVEGS